MKDKVRSRDGTKKANNVTLITENKKNKWKKNLKN